MTGGYGACQPPPFCPPCMMGKILDPRYIFTPTHTWQHWLCRRGKAICCFYEYTHDAKAGDQEENGAIYSSFKELYQKRKENIFFNVWEVEIKNRLSINEFMVSETPLSPRKT